VEIPAGALAAETRINIEQVTAGALALPTGRTALGSMFAFTPHGTTFALPVTLTLPFDPAAVPAGMAPTFYKTKNAQTEWEEIPNARFGSNSVSVQVTSFSDATVSAFTVGDVGREWTFNVQYINSVNPSLLQSGTVSGGRLSEYKDFGLANYDAEYALIDGRTFLPDGHANGAIGATEDGRVIYVGAEAMLQNANLLGVPVGSESILEQVHTFTKRLETASLTLSMPQAVIDAHDENAALHRECPKNRLLGDKCFLIEGVLDFDLEAYKAEPSPGSPVDPAEFPFFRMSGAVRVVGFAENWKLQVFQNAWSPTPMWAESDFQFVVRDFNGTAGSHAFLTLLNSPTHVVDLSRIAVGQTFHVRVFAKASTFNIIAGPPSEFPTSVGAYLRESLKPGGAMLAFSGLDVVDTPIPMPLPPPGDQIFVVPESCSGGANPGAGSIQFDSANYSILENGSLPTITVTRTGGSSGAVTATFTTGDGTARAPADYTAMHSTVFFGDGDTAPRVVRVPVVANEIGGEPDKTVKLTLSQPGACATLGTQSTALLTILDDDPAAPRPSGLDTTFGSTGKASFPSFGGDHSAMALQADGKIVMAGGTFTDFVLARFLANGSIDTNFGNAGKVTSNIVSGEQEEALAVAIQPDGKILVAGYTGQALGPSVIALARYLSTGEPDTTFGLGGEVVSTVIGRAFAIALDTSGLELKILVAGDDPAAEDMVVARFRSNGSLDPTFNNDGHLTVNVAGAGDIASNIALLPNGGILLSGGGSTGLTSTSLAKLDANGSLDPAFGNGGKLVLEGRQVGEGLAMQSDGKIVLAGKVETLVSPATQTSFEVMRLNTNGTPDSSFGTAGIVDTALSTRGDAAFAVTLQPDGKIIAVGASQIQVNANFAVVRYDTEGALDTTFGGGTGKLTVDFFGSTDVAESVVVQPDGKIVAGGLARDSVDGYGVVRINP